MTQKTLATLGAMLIAAAGICLQPGSLGFTYAEESAGRSPSVLTCGAGGDADAGCEPSVDGGAAASTAAEPAGAGGHGDERCERLPELFQVPVIDHQELRRTHELDEVRGALIERIHAAACRFGVDPAIGKGVAWTESRFDQNARSPDGLSEGAFQLTKVTAEAMRVRLAASASGLSLHDEVTLGVGYLRYLARLFGRQTVLGAGGLTTIAVTSPVERWRFAIAAYNAGEGRVAVAQHRAAQLGKNPARYADVRSLLPPITRRYVDQVIAFGASQMASLAGGSLETS
jgi:hypothetical protein